MGGEAAPTGRLDGASTDRLLEQAVAGWGGTADDAIDGLRLTLDALDGIERNAHLPTLVDAWSARLEPAPPPPPSRPVRI